MKKILTIVGISAIFGASAFAAQYVITTGSPKGNYIKYGYRMAKIMGPKNFKVIPSKGSIENFERLSKNEAQIAIAQKDAYKWYSGKHETSFSSVGDLKKECVFIVARDGSDIDSDSDLQKEGVKIAVGKPGSGTRVTWEYMGELEKGFKKATPIPASGTLALNKVLSGEYDAYMTVLTPDTKNRFIQMVNSKDDLKFIPVKDWDLNDKMKDGSQVYTFETVKYKDSFFGGKIDTICTTASVFVRDDLDENVKEKISDTIFNNLNYILKGE